MKESDKISLLDVATFEHLSQCFIHNMFVNTVKSRLPYTTIYYYRPYTDVDYSMAVFVIKYSRRLKK